MKKNKQLNPLEQHFEKLVLAGVSLVLLAVVAMQFLTQPNAVKVGNSEPVPPDRVFQVVKGEADQLIAKMRSVSPELPEVPEQDVATRFSEVSKLAIADSISMERIASTTTIGSAAADGAGIDAATTYTLPQVPVPARVAAVSYRATVDPIVWASNEELRPYLPAEQPFDLGAISIEGVVSGESLRRSLEEDPDGDEGPLRPLPLSWWKGSVDLLGVEVEREEQGPDGGWTGSTIVSGLPGGVSLLADIRREGVTPADVQRVAQQAEAVIREVAQPSFPPTIAGPEWVPPSKSSAQEPQGEENREQALLQRQADSLQRQIAAKEEQLADAGGGEPGAQDERGRGGRGGRGVREGGGGASDREERERAQLQKELESLRREHEQVLDKLEASGAQVDRAARTG
ncbi:MAG TPA: hypothetical protein VFF69_03305, partial [Phycisphaerales bacterium]|nr:hypothetical protein [Phycisphaerales bacterium]